MKKVIFIVFIIIFIIPNLFTQINLKYQKPVKEIMELADAEMPSNVRINDSATYMVYLSRNRYKSIETLSEKELRLAGLRINPVTNIGSRTRYSYGLKLYRVKKNREIPISGLPSKLKIAYLSFAPDEKNIIFTNTTETGVELWVINVNSAKAQKISDTDLNSNIGKPYRWFKNGKELLVKVLPKNRNKVIDKVSAIPTGPIISVNSGKKAQNRTYQDLLKDSIDEENFENLIRSELYKIKLDGSKTLWLEEGLYSDLNFSPDGKFILVKTIEKPFSYLVTYYRFPAKIKLFASDGKFVKLILNLPLIEDLPKGFMAVRKGKRSISWRDDKSSTLVWVEALDKGDPKVKAQYRDQVFEQDVPVIGNPIKLIKTINRYAGIIWGNKNLAVIIDYWWNSRNSKTYIFDPSIIDGKGKKVFDRNYQDRYNDPGSFITEKNNFGENTLYINNGKLFLKGTGYSKSGIRPFVDQFQIKTGKIKRLWREDGKNTLETLYSPLNMKKGIFLSRIQSSTKFPNFYIRNVFKKNRKPKKLTFFKNPFKSIQNVQKKLIKYKREDGLELSGTLYLPTNYEKGEKYPMFLWAYPREFKSKKSAGQSTSSSNRFTYPHYGSPILWVTRGYVVLDNASFPIIGEKDEEPNDTFIKQLVSNGKAAIDAVDKLGYIDRNRVAVGGHSYGAFMAANLLSHSNLFAAGIARSGAYNRTLTPFGFQSEERNYWEAPEVYYKMSPFMHADTMKTPLLLIHGVADNNSGTYPMQSERYFNALKGLGAIVRLVMLPKESHGYAARESVLHILWEQDMWLEKYVKNHKIEKK